MKKLASINSKIQAATADKTQVVASYEISDDSVQAELRLRASWTISVPVDIINYPKDINPDRPNRALWEQMYNLATEIRRVATLVDHRSPDGYGYHSIKINARLKNGEAKRAEAKAAWQIEVGRQFLTDYREVSKKSTLTKVRQQITALQAQQKALIPKLRESNSAYLSKRKMQSTERARKNAEALTSGRFWEADKETLKGYFHPPFDRNYLADVSGKWRAALYTEMASTAWKAGSGDWRHKNIGTGRAYFCGIDDNGDEWGHRINLSEYLGPDEYGDIGYAGVTVEDAMAEIFGIQKNKLNRCTRQGDLLFCSVTLRKQPWKTDTCQNCGQKKDFHGIGYCENFIAKIAQPIELHPHEGPWEIRESHEVLSTGLRCNGGQYFSSPNPLYIRHTSHPMQVLPPGEYRLYELQEVEAD